MTFDRVRQSLRTLARHKRFVATAVACLGIAIALNTTMYSVLDALINPQSDVREPEQLQNVAYFGDYRGQIPFHERAAALQAATFHQGIAHQYFTPTEDRVAERGAELRDVNVMTVSATYFALHGVHAMGGRLLDSRDADSPDRPIVIGERLWTQLFPGQERFSPTEILVGGVGRPVVGMLPKTAFSKGAGPMTDIWQLPPRGQQPFFYNTVVRLRPGVPVAQAEAELRAISQRFNLITGDAFDAGYRIRPAEIRSYRTWSFQYALIGSVFAVLLIACANLANLQLARGVSRARELATRAAVGASRADIIWQLVLESSWLAAGGLALGGVLTVWGIQLIEHYVPKEVAEYMTYPQVSWRVFVFGIGVTVFSLVLVGLLPAIRLSRVDINELLKSGAGTGSSRSARRQYGSLVIAEVALALALLCSTGLLIRSAVLVHAYDFTNDYRGVVTAEVLILRSSPTDRRTRREVAEEVRRQALRTDSVVLASTSDWGMPPKKAVTTYGPGGELVVLQAPRWGYSIVSADYFRVRRMPVQQGRDFSPGEFAEPEVIVDSMAAKALWPGQNPIGKQLKVDSSHVAAPWYRVVGVVGEYRRWFNPDQDVVELERARAFRERGDRMVGQVWVLDAADNVPISSGDVITDRARPGTTTRGFYIGLAVRARGDYRRLPLALRDKLAELGPMVRPSYPRTWEESSGMARMRARYDFMASLFTVFAFFALVLAALGVYAIIAHMVAQRTREFGVRIAVGAGDKDIREIVLREGNILTLLGIAIGLLITYKTAGWVRAFVFSDWDRYDSRVFAVVALVLFATAWLASYLPARRAMRINPVEALRND